MSDLLRPPIASEVWVVVIEHREGQDIAVHQTVEGAKDYVAAYCEEWWKEVTDEANPADADERIMAYFEWSTDRYSITRCYVRNGR